MRTPEQILSALIAEERGTDALPERLCQECRTSLPVDGAGLAWMSDAGHQGVIAATEGLAKEMEDLQFSLGEGPCVDAFGLRRWVLEPDLIQNATARWPAFGPAAAQAGIAAIFAFPLQIGGIRLGALDLYRESAGALDAEQLTGAQTYADAAVLVLLHLQNAVEPEQGLPSEIGDPLENRAEIHQATGAISVQAGVSLADALLLLRAHAFAADESAMTVARHVLKRTLHFTLDEEHNE